MRRIAFLALLPSLLLAGCAFTTPSTSAPKPQEGAVVMSVNYINRSHAMSNIAGADIVLQKGNKFLGNVLVASGSNNFRYGKALPPGTYRLATMTTRVKGTDIYVQYPKEHVLGTFTVKPGQITYLGNLMTIARAPQPGSNSMFGPVQAAHEGSALDLEKGKQFIARHFPQFAALSDKPLLTWDSGSYDDAYMQKAYPLFRKVAHSDFSMLDLGERGQLFGMRSGLIVHFMPGKPSKFLDIGDPLAVTALLALPDGALLAGIETGLLRISRDEGKTWQPIPVDLPIGTIDKLMQTPDGSIYVVMRRTLPRTKMHLLAENSIGNRLREPEELQIYRGRLGDTTWTKLFTGPRPNTFLRYPIDAFIHEGSLLILADEEKLFSLDLASGQVTQRNYPESRSFVSRTPEGLLFSDSYLYRPEIRYNPFTSSDGGKTWTHMNTAMSIHEPLFRDARHGIAMVYEAPSPTYVETSDGGVTWTPIPGSHPYRLLGFSRDGLLFAYKAGQDALLFSKDNGRQWREVLSLAEE